MKKCMFIIVCLSLLFLAGCDINKPVTPQWDVNFNVPLMNKDYYAGDLVDSTNFYLGADSVLFFNTAGDIQGAEMEDNKLKISANNDGSGFVPIIKSPDQHIITIANPEMQDDVEIVSSTVKNGRLRFQFTNIQTQLDTIHIVFEELKTPNGQPFDIAIARAQFIQNEIYINIANYKFQNSNDSILTDLHFSLSATAPTAPDYTPLGQIKISYSEDIIFSAIKGLIHDMVIDAEEFTTSIDVEYPDNVENALHLNSPIVKFNVWNRLGYEAIFNGTLYSKNSRTGQERWYTLEPRTINAATAVGDSTYTLLTFHNSVETLMSIAPDIVKLQDATFTLHNPSNTIGFASEGAGYSGTYNVTVPFDMSFTANQPLRPKELITTAISEENRDQIKKNAKEIILTVKVWNEFEIGANVNLYLCNSNNKDLVYNNTEIHTPALTRVVFLNNQVDAGTQLSPHYQELTFVINQEDLALFTDYEEVNFGLQFTFDNSTSSIQSTDKIKVISVLEAKMTINGDTEEGR